MDYKKLSELLFPNVSMTEQQLEEKYPERGLKEGAVCTRMAPSPTGFVHLGNLIQGLTSERLAHQSGGVLFLRVEDTDQKRTVEGAVEALIDGVGHYGIKFDEGVTADGETGNYGPYRQRSRAEIYHVYAKRLVAEGMAYPCFCTEDELERNHALQEQNKENFGYYGKWAVWRDRPIEDIEEQLKAGKPWVLRFRSNGSIENKIKFTDLIKGTLELTENDIDHVLLKSDGIPTYHFAHAVDDHLMRTTHVVRGDEWLSTLPFHIQLFRALGFKVPKYLHIGPLMKMDGSSKRKLSKRKDPELGLSYYKAQGFPTESVGEYLMTVLNSNYEDWRRANPDTPKEQFKFSVKKMNPAGSLFDYMKLCDVSKNVISKFSAEKVAHDVTEWAKEFDKELYDLLSRDEKYTVGIFSIDRGGKKPRKDLAKWNEVRDYISYFFDETFEPCIPENVAPQDVVRILKNYLWVYNQGADKDQWFADVKSICHSVGFSPDVKAYKAEPDKFKGHVGDVSTVIRVAVTGRTNTPDLCAIMKLLGRVRVRDRIEEVISALQ